MEGRFAEVMAFVLNTLIDLNAETFTIELTEVPSIPVSVRIIGTTTLVLTGGILARVITGTEPNVVEHTRFYWAAAGGV